MDHRKLLFAAPDHGRGKFYQGHSWCGAALCPTASHSAVPARVLCRNPVAGLRHLQLPGAHQRAKAGSQRLQCGRATPRTLHQRRNKLQVPGPLRCPKEVGPCSFVVVTALHQRARDQLGAVVGKPVQPPLSRQVVTVEMETCVRGVACADHPKGIVDHQQYD